MKNIKSINQLYEVLDAISVSLDTNLTREQILGFYNVFKKVLSTDEYFTKDTSVYIDFGDTAYDITNLKRVKNESLNIRNNRSKLNKNKIFQTRRYNKKYNISVVTNTRSSDNSLFISIMKPMIVVILLTVGIVCFLCARLIVGFILEPLEGISIKMKHFK